MRATVHPLLQPGPVEQIAYARTPKTAKMSDIEEADRIAGALLAGTGPILLCMPGTGGKSYEGIVAATAREFIRQLRGAVSIASIPYGNGTGAIPARFLAKSSHSVLAMVIERLHKYAPHRPIFIVGESQGSWVAAKDLLDPQIAAAVTRVMLFSKPAFQPLPASVGQAAHGAANLGLNPQPGIAEIRHSDDIVPSLFNRLDGDIIGGFAEKVLGGLMRGNPQYPPHKYAVHGVAAARYLLYGEAPSNAVHESDVDRTMPQL